MIGDNIRKPTPLSKLKDRAGYLAKIDDIDPYDGTQRMGSLGVLEEFGVPFIAYAANSIVGKEWGLDVVLDTDWLCIKPFKVIKYANIPYILVEHDPDIGILYLVPVEEIIVQA